MRIMERNQKKKGLTFGEFIAGVFDTCGKQKGGRIVCLAVIAHLVEFQDASVIRFRKNLEKTCKDQVLDKQIRISKNFKA